MYSFASYILCVEWAPVFQHRPGREAASRRPQRQHDVGYRGHAQQSTALGSVL
jgi:hypothetical protein